MNLTILILIFILTILSIFFYKLFQCPIQIQHIPAIPISQTLYGLMTKSIYQITKEHQELQKKYGVIRIWTSGRWLILVSDIVAIKRILYSSNYPKFLLSSKLPYSSLAKYLGLNIVCSNGKEWKQQKTKLKPLFQNLNKEELQPLLKRFEMRIHQDFRLNIDYLILDCLTHFLFGFSVQDKDQVLDPYHRIMKNNFCLRTVLFPFLDCEWNPFTRSIHKDIEKIQSIFKDQIQAHDQNKVNLINLIENQELILSNMMVFLLAGYETLSTTMLAMIHLLAKHPTIQDKAVSQLKNHDSTYLTQIIKETLRLFPPLSRIPDRINLEELTIRGLMVPKNCHIVVDIYQLHLNSEVFEHPNQFIPERFDKNYSLDFLPFSNGMRQCLAKNWALEMIKELSSHLLLKYEFTYLEEVKDFPLNSNVFLMLNELNLKIQERS